MKLYHSSVLFFKRDNLHSSTEEPAISFGVKLLSMSFKQQQIVHQVDVTTKHRQVIRR